MRRYHVIPLISGLVACLPAVGASPEAIFSQTCIACHGANGKGAVPGVPDLTAATGPLAKKSNEQLATSILNGLKSPGASMAMPPKGGNPALSAADATALVEYLRQRFRPTSE